MTSLRTANLGALTYLFTEAGGTIGDSARNDGIRVITARSGAPVLEWEGRALDSRRDPAQAAASAASDVAADVVVVLGFGTGYLVEALLARGVTVAAVVDASAVLSAALDARDLGAILSRVPVVALESLGQRGRLAQLRAMGAQVVVHAPSATAVPELAALAEQWSRLAAARPPRVLVAGPIAGGSLGVARHVAAAAATIGAQARLFDASPFAGAQRGFGELAISATAQTCFQGRLAMLLGEAVVEAATAWNADLVLALAQAPLSEPALTALGARGIPTAFWFVENTRVLPYWRDVARHYDRFYAIQPGAVLEQIGAAGARAVSYLPMACAPAVHRMVPLGDEERVRFGSPVSFAGAPYLNRRHVLAAIADLGLKVWGEGWETTALSDALGAPGRFDLDTMLRVFAASRVNVNVHSADHVTGLDPQPDYVNPRTFELAACGAFQLVDRRDPLAALFDDDEIAVFDTVADLRDKAQYYLARFDEAVAIAERGRRRAVSDHTYEARVRQILSDCLASHLQPCATAPEAVELDAALEQAAATPTLDEAELYLRMLVEVREATSSR
jgi:spore maturation protein CgeB